PSINRAVSDADRPWVGRLRRTPAPDHMPRGRKADVFGAIRAEASKAMAVVEARIREIEAELEKLVAQANAWRQAVGVGGAAGPGRRRGRPAGKKRPPGRPKTPVNWDEVLASVSKQFSIQDVLEHSGLPGRAGIGSTRRSSAGRPRSVSGRV